MPVDTRDELNFQANGQFLTTHCLRARECELGNHHRHAVEGRQRNFTRAVPANPRRRWSDLGRHHLRVPA